MLRSPYSREKNASYIQGTRLGGSQCGSGKRGKKESVSYMESNSSLVPVKPFRLIHNNKTITLIITIMCKTCGYSLMLINTINYVNFVTCPERNQLSEVSNLWHTTNPFSRGSKYASCNFKLYFSKSWFHTCSFSPFKQHLIDLNRYHRVANDFSSGRN